MAILTATGIAKTYRDMAEPIKVLKGLDFTLNRGDVIGIYGASGSGKSTLLHIFGGLDKPDEGDVRISDSSIIGLSDDKLAEFRNKEVGFVFQFYHLLPEFTSLENVMMPSLIAGMGKGKARDEAMAALEAVGLSNRVDHRPAMLSGGEQQRVALARAVVMKPPIILADEPTGNLDPESGNVVWNYLMTLNKNYDMALVIVTHNRDLIKSLPNVYELADGVLRSVDIKG